ncbi:MAG: Cell division protein FtsA [Dehalococcoidales bacterium]|nr:Cell division protein FtsA [Dehalococcoidales bacterium]
MKRSRIAAIDVGTTKVCTIMADNDGNGGLRIIGVGIAPSHGLQKGLVVNVNEAKESIRDSVRKAERVAGYRLESAYVGVTGRHISSINNTGTIVINRNDQLVRSSDLKRVLDVARSVKIPSESKLLHVIPRSYAVDGQEGVKNPVGMHGFRLDVEAHIITAAVASVQNLTKCIRGVGIEIEDLLMEPLASAEAVLSEEEKMNGVMVADIGGGTTDIAVIKDNTIYHTAVIPVAGYQITRDISVGLGLSHEMAEEMKKKYGDVMPVEKDAAEGDRPVIQDGHSVSYNDLSDIIHVRVEELLRLIVMELPRTDFAKLIPAGLVLTGGSANLPGIAELGEQVTRIPVRVGAPTNLFGVTDTLRDPAYSTGVGLILWQLKNKGAGEQSWVKSRSGLSRFFSRILPLFR